MEYKKLSFQKEDLTEQEILDRRLFNVFVFGLPRSGTSMMSGVLERIGVKMIYSSDDEEELKKRNENERKRYGDEYQMNKDGFYEITKNIWENYMKVLSTPYSGCKMIIPVNGFRSDMVTFNPCAKVIQMWRDPEEIRQSQQASYKGDELVTEEMAEDQCAVIRSSLVNQKLRLEKLKIETLHVQYRDVLDDTENQISKIAGFVRSTEKIDNAVNWVSPDKIRFKKEELVVGI